MELPADVARRANLPIWDENGEVSDFGFDDVAEICAADGRNLNPENVFSLMENWIPRGCETNLDHVKWALDAEAHGGVE